MTGKPIFSPKYNLMVYFVCTTIHIYSANVVMLGRYGNDATSDISRFIAHNSNIIKRVHEEAKSMFGYELSDRQMTLGINYYLHGKFNPQSTENTKPFTFDES